jgi:pyruvate kinase
VDIVAVSFVQDAEDVKTAKKIALEKNEEPFIIAKIEKREAVENLESIVKESDGVMVARGDLGVELNYEFVPVIQKKIINEANRNGKPVITATQILESMVSSPTPTRAETTDVANAIIDGSDALMLAEETAVGKYPVQAVQVLSQVAMETEKYLPKQISDSRRLWYDGHAPDDAIALAACEASLEVGASAIVSRTRTGKTARLVAKYRPPLPVLALTPNQKVLSQLLLSWGVKPILADNVTLLEDVFRDAEKTVKRLRLARKGDKIVVVCGDPEAPAGHTEIMKIQSVK